MSASVEAAIDRVEVPPEPRLEWLVAIPAAIGGAVRSTLAALGRTARFLAETARAARDVSTWWPEARQQAMRLGVELRRTAAQVRALSLRFEKSQGRLDSLLANSNSVFEKIDRGQGSLGLMVNDPAMYRHSDSLVVQLRDLVSDIKSNPKKYLTVRLF